MIDNRTKKLSVAFFLSILAIAGCGGESQKAAKPAVSSYEIKLDDTIGALADVSAAEKIPIEGFALVGGLEGKGSGECPPAIRLQIEKYIRKQIPRTENASQFIDSHDTAVVYLQAMMPAATTSNEKFDVKVQALAGAEKVSLKGGELWGAELKQAGKMGKTLRILAQVEGPVYVDRLDEPVNESIGYVLGGGTALEEYGLSLILRQPDYKLANAIRNKLSERFGYQTAKAFGPGAIQLKVPAKYDNQKARFVSIVRSMYMTNDPRFLESQIDAHIRTLAINSEKWQSEAALEAIGDRSLAKLGALLNSYDAEVQFRAARCMLNLGDDKALETLQKIVNNPQSPYRFDALRAISAAARRNDTAVTARRLLKDDDFEMRLAAYKELNRMDDISIVRNRIGKSFYLDQLSHTDKKDIYVSREGEPTVVLFGAPLEIRKNIFIQTPDGNITLNSPAGQNYVTIIRKIPGKSHINPIQIKTRFSVADIIRGLGDSPIQARKSRVKPGLNIPYSEIVTLLRELCQKGAVDATFHAGTLPEISRTAKN
jgi:tetratricopeptide (TPR) repeat protein